MGMILKDYQGRKAMFLLLIVEITQYFNFIDMSQPKEMYFQIKSKYENSENYALKVTQKIEVEGPP